MSIKKNIPEMHSKNYLMWGVLNLHKGTKVLQTIPSPQSYRESVNPCFSLNDNPAPGGFFC